MTEYLITSRNGDQYTKIESIVTTYKRAQQWALWYSGLLGVEVVAWHIFSF